MGRQATSMHGSQNTVDTRACTFVSLSLADVQFSLTLATRNYCDSFLSPFRGLDCFIMKKRIILNKYKT